MSNIEIHIGKLVIAKTIKNHQEFMRFVHENKLTAYGEVSIDDFGSSIILCDSFDPWGKYKYVYYKNVIYKFVSHNEYDDSFVNEWTANHDGSIDFITMFYNSGTCFYEVLENAIDKLNK